MEVCLNHTLFKVFECQLQWNKNNDRNRFTDDAIEETKQDNKVT